MTINKNITETVRVLDDEVYETNEPDELDETYEVLDVIQRDAKKIGKTAKNYLNKKKIGITVSATDFFKALIDDLFIGTGTVYPMNMNGILMDKTEINNPEEYFENLRDEDDEMLYLMNKTHVLPERMFDYRRNTVEWGYSPINARYGEYSMYYIYKDAIYDMLYLLHTVCENIVYTNNIRNYHSQIDFKRTYDLLKKCSVFRNNNKLKNIIYLMKVSMSILKRIKEEAYEHEVYEDEESEITIPEFLDKLTIKFLIPNIAGKEKKKKTYKKVKGRR